MGGPPAYGRRSAKQAVEAQWGWSDARGTLGEMRARGVRSIVVRCNNCHHGAIVNADRWQGETSLRALSTAMLCTACNHVGADVRPDWEERS